MDAARGLSVDRGLGPLLFGLYLEDIFEKIKGKKKKETDKVLLFASGASI